VQEDQIAAVGGDRRLQGSEQVQATDVRRPDALQVQDHPPVTTEPKCEHRATQQVHALRGQVPSGSDRPTVPIEILAEDDRLLTGADRSVKVLHDASSP
jgi:hypothetical protein